MILTLFRRVDTFENNLSDWSSDIFEIIIFSFYIVIFAVVHYWVTSLLLFSDI